MQHAQGASRHDGGLSVARSFRRLLCEDQRIRVDRRIALLDPTEVGLDDLDRRNVASPNPSREFSCGEEAQIGGMGAHVTFIREPII